MFGMIQDIDVGPPRTAILQIHPSLRCNLFCDHCYSNSGPSERAEIAAATVCDVISDAAAMGYRVVSISGGEPMMYRDLAIILAHSKSLDLYTTVTTNGFFAVQKQLARLSGLVDLLAFSLDGPPEIHNKIRGSANAFERLEAGLKNVRESSIPFGIITTLTRENWHHLLWVAAFAAENGARLLQIHPLEMAGRASSEMAEETPEDDTLAKVYVLAFALAAKYEGTMAVQLDALFREHLREEPELVYAGELEVSPEKASPAQLVGLIVLEPDGSIVPMSYGFARDYRLCDVNTERLVDSWPYYLENKYHSFRAICQNVWYELSAPNAPLLSNWHEVVVSRSHSINSIKRG